jgi:hypothetical protein
MANGTVNPYIMTHPSLLPFRVSDELPLLQVFQLIREPFVRAMQSMADILVFAFSKKEYRL